MATWLDLARETRAAANELFGGDHYRSFISRAYYAVYARATHSLVSIPVAMAASREGPAHKKLCALIETHLTSMERSKRESLSRIVGQLYFMRCRADYFPSDAIDRIQARMALTLMKKAFDFF